MVEKQIPMIEASKTLRKDVILDPSGFFVIIVLDEKIIVESYSNVTKDGRIVSGKLRRVFRGTRADALCDTIARFEKDLLPEHYLYLGRELMHAEEALIQKKPYVQGGC
jgi:hypothetical protein